MKYFTLLFCILICSTTLLAQEIDDLKQKSTAPTFVVIDEFGTVDLVVNETEVTQVLEMLAIQGRRNIIASNSVAGVVSANLYDVTFNEALESFPVSYTHLRAHET